MAIRKSIQNLVDVEVYGDILLHDPKFLEGDNVITVDYLKDKLIDYTNELDDQIARVISSDPQTKRFFLECMIDAITSNEDVRSAYKMFFLRLLSYNDDAYKILRNHILNIISKDTEALEINKGNLVNLLNSDEDIGSIHKGMVLNLLSYDEDIQKVVKKIAVKWIIFNDGDADDDYSYEDVVLTNILDSPYFLSLIMDDDTGYEGSLFGYMTSVKAIFNE